MISQKPRFILPKPCWLCWQAVCFWQLFLPVFDLPIFGGLGRYKIWFLLSYAVLCFPSVMGTVARAMDQMKPIAYASILSALIMGVLAFMC